MNQDDHRQRTISDRIERLRSRIKKEQYGNPGWAALLPIMLGLLDLLEDEL